MLINTSIETIVINTDKKKFFYEYLVLKRPIFNVIISKLNNKKIILSDKPLHLLAELLYLYDLYSNLPENERWQNVFSYDSRRKIMEDLELKEHYFNNYLSLLRRIKIIHNNTINKVFLVPAKNLELRVSFIINGQEK